MKILKKTGIIVMLVVQFATMQNIQAQTLPDVFNSNFNTNFFNKYSSNTYTKPSAWMLQSQPEIESPLRRAEIIFFLSLPFVALANILVYGTGYYIYDNSYDFNMENMPVELLAAMGITTLGLSAYIAFHDYKVTSKKGQENNGTDANDIKEKQVIFFIQSKF